MSRQPSNMRRQWARVHRWRHATSAILSRSQQCRLAAGEAVASTASAPNVVLPESALVRFMLGTSLFLNRATWFALIALTPLLGQTNILSAAEGDVFAPPAATEVRTHALQWVAERGVTDKALREQIAREWTFGETNLTAEEVFDRVIRTLTLADADAQKIVAACQDATPTAAWPREVVATSDSMNEFARQHLRLYVGRFLAQRQLFEEALEVLTTIDPKQVVDPAGYFFNKALCQHQLLKKSDALKTLQLLLDSTQNAPARYTAVAVLMRHDIEQMREASLGEVARKMLDVERRLSLARPGEKTQKVEEEIIESLDEIIKKIEQQQSGAGGGGGQGGNQNQSGGAAGDSQVKGATAPGEVDKKDIGNKAGWGTMPPKAAAKAKNVINRNFPSHYREAIEQYFKKLANRPAAKE
jgi:tetratricopeptide (TPR) repeat protein